jgi:hypothetical protein
LLPSVELDLSDGEVIRGICAKAIAAQKHKLKEINNIFFIFICVSY